jgi:uncharacterized protein YaiE (UPF0345 family)
MFQSVGSNIGIGLNNPNVALTINGQLSATGSMAGNQNIIINNSLYNQASMALVNYLGTQAILATDVNNWNNSLRIADSRDAAYPNTVSLYSNNNIRMFVAANGNVKIGSDSNPQAKLDVDGDVRATNTPKALVNFDGINGSVVAGEFRCNILKNYNINRVVRTTTGRYTVYFATPAPDAYYVVTGACNYNNENNDNLTIFTIGSQFTNYCQVVSRGYGSAAGYFNPSSMQVVIHY